MIVVDSSGWLEYFADGPNASFFEKALQHTENLLVPSISLYEVFKKISLERDENFAIQAVALMQQGQVVELDSTLALSAAKLSLEYRIPMADSVILATARKHNAVLYTQDADFDGIPGVKFKKKS